MKKVFSFLLILSMVVSMSGLPLAKAVAKTVEEGNKITICHATGEGNYVSISPNKNGVLNGHDNHEDDIIPAFDDYAGKNWTTEGQAIYNNDCQKTDEDDGGDDECVPGTDIIVSDTSTQVEEHDSVAVTPHPAWTASIEGATWIYDEALNENGSSTTGDKVFTKTFTIDGTPTDSTLEIAADNMYSVKVNGIALDTDTSATDLNNFASADSWTIPAADLHSGSNSIEITITNPAVDPETNTAFGDPNPAGLLYKLTVNHNCEPEVPTTATVTMCKTDDSEAVNYLSGWTLTLGENSGTTGEEGCVEFTDVPYGTYTAGEVMQEGWIHNSESDDTGVVVVDSPEETFTIVNHNTSDDSEDSCEAGAYTDTSDNSGAIRFENAPYTTGSISGQDGWSNAVNPAYDQSVVTNTYGYPSFDNQSLRMSDAVTSGSFGDWVFAKPLTNAAGESTTVGATKNHFEAQFDIASTRPCEQQPGLHISVSPDRGDGSRMSYLRFEDGPTGLDVFFYDVSGTDAGTVSFDEAQVASGLTRNIPHKIKFVMDFVDGTNVNGSANDIVKIYIDGTLVKTGTSWETYYRYDAEASAEQAPRAVNTLIFQARGSANPANLGKGYLFDNLTLSSSTTQTNTDDQTPPTKKPKKGSSTGGRINTPVGQVLGAETSCGIYLDKYIKMGRKNDPEAVKKVQKFLNDFMKAGLKEDGILGKQTDKEIKKFQWDHKKNILDPWKLKMATGIVYLTTQTEINNIMCPSLALPIPKNLTPFESNPAAPKP